MNANRPSLRRSIESLEHRDFRLLFFSSVVSSMGGQLQIIANTWQVFELTGSALEIGVIGVAPAIPLILFAVAGGVIADRVDRRRIIMTTQLLNGGGALALAIVTAMNLAEPWHIYAITFLNAATMSVSAPGRRAIIAGLVPRHHLTNALGLNQTLQQTSRVIAPSLAGLLIAAFGLAICYFITAIATIVTAVWLTFIRVTPLPDRPKASALEDLAEGLTFVRKQPLILGVLGADVVGQLFGMYQVLLPFFADAHGMGAAGFGLLSSAPAVGALVGAAFVMSLGDVRYKGYWIVGSIIAYSVCLAVLALSPWFVLSVIVVTALGFTDSFQAVMRNTLIQIVTPDELRGRVAGFQGMLVNAPSGIGLALMGGAAGAIGAPIALIGGAILGTLANLGILASIRELRAADVAEPAPTSGAAQ